MTQRELKKRAASLQRFYLEFPFLSRLVEIWDPENYEIVVITMNSDEWRKIREEKSTIWFKIKATKQLGFYGDIFLDAFLQYYPLEEQYNLEGLVLRFKSWGSSLPVKEIEYIVLEKETDRGKKILVFRPPKGQKTF